VDGVVRTRAKPVSLPQKARVQLVAESRKR
jgi:hypothetical protein